MRGDIKLLYNLKLQIIQFFIIEFDASWFKQIL